MRMRWLAPSGGWTGRAARTFAVNVLGVALSVALQLVLARAVGVDEYGRYVYVITWVTVLAVACLLGYDSASLRFVPEHRARGEHGAVAGFFRLAQRRGLIAAAPIALMAGVAAAGLAIGTQQASYWIYGIGALLLPCAVLFHLYAYFLQGLRRADEALALQLVVRPLLLIAGCSLIAWGFRTPDAVDLLLLTLAVTGGVAALEAWRVRSLTPAGSAPAADPDYQRQWGRAAGSMLLITIAQQVLVNGDILMVGLLAGTTEAGVYAVASRLAAIVSFAVSSINFVLAPTIADLHARGQRAELQAAVTTATRAGFAYALPVLAIMLLAGGWMLRQFGADFEEGYPVLVLLCLGQAAICFNGAVGFLLTMTGHHDAALRVIGLSAALMVILALALGTWWGAVGVAAAAAIAQAVRSLALGRCAQQALGVRASVVA